MGLKRRRGRPAAWLVPRMGAGGRSALRDLRSRGEPERPFDPGPHGSGWRAWRPCPVLCWSGDLSEELKNPIPSRTRPLNSSAPMVLCLKTRESRSLPGLPRTCLFTTTHTTRRFFPSAAFVFVAQRAAAAAVLRSRTLRHGASSPGWAQVARGRAAQQGLPLRNETIFAPSKAQG